MRKLLRMCIKYCTFAVAFENNQKQKYKLPWVLYTDSVTALAWVREKRCKSKLEWNEENTDLILMVRKAEEWLRANTWTTEIRKWETTLWGEIPADFGRK